MLSPRSPFPRLADSPDRRDVPTICRLALQMLADAACRPRGLRVTGPLDVMKQRGDFAQGGGALTAAEPPRAHPAAIARQTSAASWQAADQARSLRHMDRETAKPGPDLINALGVGVECARPYAPS
jgi:hypothetical protein